MSGCAGAQARLYKVLVSMDPGLVEHAQYGMVPIQQSSNATT